MTFNITWSLLGNEALPKTARWHPEPLTRGTQSILLASLITLSLCVWTALHLNIPPPGATVWTKLRRKLKWLVFGVLMPEYILYVAATQWLCAQAAHQRILISFEKHGLQEAPILSRWQKLWRAMFLSQYVGGMDSDHQEEEVSRDGLETVDIELAEIGVIPEIPTRRRRNPWTICHTHYLKMGGLFFDPRRLVTTDEGELSSDNPQTEPGSRLFLTAEAIVFLSKHAPDLIPDISEAEIIDKSNADGLSRLLAILQAFWFFVQFIARLIIGLPVTILELNVVAHIGFAILVYIFWWKKPLDIYLPTEVTSRSSEDRSLLAAMYIRSRVGYMQRVDGHSPTNPHTGFLDLAAEPRQVVSSTESAAPPDDHAGTSDHGGNIESSTTTALPFEILLGQAKHGVRLVAWAHIPDNPLYSLAIGTTQGASSIVGNFIILDNDTTPLGCICSSFRPHVVKSIRVTISDIRCRLFELARSCEHLSALGDKPGRHESAIKAYLERLRSTPGFIFSRGKIFVLQSRRNFVTEAPAEVDNEEINAVVTIASTLCFFFYSSIFGALHLLAWNGPFHTDTELILWRVAASTLASPLVIIVLVLVAFLLWLILTILATLLCLFNVFICRFPTSWLEELGDDAFSFQMTAIRVIMPRLHGIARTPAAFLQIIPWQLWIIGIAAFILAPILIFYIGLFFLARFYFLAECVINVIFAPPRVFELPSWVSYIPHIG